MNKNIDFLVITDRYDPYEEELLDCFKYETEALDHAESIADLYGVNFCKVLKRLDGESRLIAYYRGRYFKN